MPNMTSGWLNSYYTFIEINQTSMFMIVGVAAFICLLWQALGSHSHDGPRRVNEKPELTIPPFALIKFLKHTIEKSHYISISFLTVG